MPGPTNSTKRCDNSSLSTRTKTHPSSRKKGLAFSQPSHRKSRESLCSAPMLGNKNRSYRKGNLKIFQANVARGQANHDLALALAATERADIILLQEPWIFPHRDSRTTKQHPDYDNFSPTDNWENRPRVMTYVRKSQSLGATQIRPIETSDICWIKTLRTTPPITIVNIYRPPRELEGGPVISALTQ